MTQKQKKQWTPTQLLRMVVSVAVILCYIVGIVLMMLHHMNQGLLLWVISTLAGIGILYVIRTNEKKEADQRQEDAEEAERLARERQE